MLTGYGDIDKLGTISYAEVETITSKLIIVNAYTQFKFGSGLQTDYEAVRSCFKIIKNKFGELKIAYPKIGAGLGGGDWDIISKIIEEELAGTQHYLVVL